MRNPRAIQKSVHGTSSILRNERIPIFHGDGALTREMSGRQHFRQETLSHHKFLNASDTRDHSRLYFKATLTRTAAAAAMTQEKTREMHKRAVLGERELKQKGAKKNTKMVTTTFQKGKKTTKHP